MKPFGNPFKRESTPASSSSTEWDQLARDEKDRANTLRQQDKIIATIVSGDPMTLSESSVNLPAGSHEGFVKAISENRVTDNHWNFILSNIAGPIDREAPTDTYNKMSDDTHMKRILAYSTGLDPDKIDVLSANNLAAFEKNFPTPLTFEETSNRFLAMLAANNNSEKKLAEYEESMADFKRTIYGKKQEYWEAIKGLKHEASELSTQETVNFNPEIYMKSAKIDGDPYQYNGNFYQLTTELLKQAGLAPATEIEINGKKIGLSKVFDMGSHPACMAYVSSDKGTKICTYYQSSSSGSWRYMPDYAADSHWIGKGYNEESLTLPFDMQKELTKLSSNEHLPIDPIAAEFIFYGTGKSYEDKKAYLNTKTAHALRGDSYQESSSSPIITLSPDLAQKTGLSRPAPEFVGTELLKTDYQPNFKQALDSYNMHTKLYGDVTVQKFPSENGKLSYIMCETVKNGRREAWLSSVEAETSMTSSGTPKEWVAGGVLATPLYEYESQAIGYGNPNDIEGGYTNMWDNYLSKIPFIQKYLKDTEM